MFGCPPKSDGDCQIGTHQLKKQLAWFTSTAAGSAAGCRHRRARRVCRQAQQARRLDLGQTSSFAKTAIYKMNKFLDEID
ncbi:hypothetical protein L195_g055309 [Trifolium pratense]|uniref:Uncharacterized protein n=1 Tax=Trifolium pratense TaxID=57577 RepID=A0A2K3KKS4_TRIPR|nr:hypothetical protein L195_g055309 [Trifolium pratense]